MKVITTSLEGLRIIEPRVFTDQRGFFYESYNENKFIENGIDVRFVQDNHSKSSINTIRGLHYQINPGQGKLVRVVAGEIFDVAVDIRQGSPTFGKWFGCHISAENTRQLYIPVGFAHGFCVTSDVAEVLYKCTEFYSPQNERGIAWNDPAIGIDWPTTEPVLSERDQNHPVLSQLDQASLFSY